ncbi:hypothetical protein EXIGLDRAFT_701426 [Exidia glandulosa HHB12029]|uniref:Chromo domain-containing protein n=1 Tax=Exidia glandulosa HHB12029 TaxID=1314781 RepID=A0A165LUX4_EXIGL|nr:hypothetical protein EXIGLDRAFT_701426 [Exidia glandulosa HHB12029]
MDHPDLHDRAPPETPPTATRDASEPQSNDDIPQAQRKTPTPQLIGPQTEIEITASRIPRPNAPTRNPERAAPEYIQGDVEFYEGDRILKHRKHGRGHQFLIHYKGLPIHESTWRPTRELRERDPELLDAYLKKTGLVV